MFSIYLDNENEKLFPIFEKHNYNIEKKEWNLFILKGKSAIKNDISFKIKRLSEMNDKIYSINFEDDGGDWNINRIKMLIKHENYYYLTLSKNAEILSVAGLYIGNGFSRVDDVITPAIHRGKGYSQQLMIKLIEYHSMISNNHIFLYADNPIAIHVYKKCGFEIIDNKLPAWEASKRFTKSC